ncbi:hypothetical protein L9F63_009003, partial [Diploptera punctata]
RSIFFILMLANQVWKSLKYQFYHYSFGNNTFKQLDESFAMNEFQIRVPKAMLCCCLTGRDLWTIQGYTGYKNSINWFRNFLLQFYPQPFLCHTILCLIFHEMKAW